nr:hypothetical protein BaRGS_012581 [Batillaria attramentaria]
MMTATVMLLVLIALCWMSGFVDGSDAYIKNCTTSAYYEEGTSRSCECTSTSPSSQARFSWPGHSNTSILRIDNIRRTDNGTQFTCLMEFNGNNSTEVFTLQVAYGPDPSNTSIEGPSTFVTNGENLLTLTCAPKGVNPTIPGTNPLYSWTGVTCINGSTNQTCSFRPDPRFHDGVSITCRVQNRYVTNVTSAYVYPNFILNLTYPPMSKPRIQGIPPDKILQDGDKLTCTVKGGKPLVSSVDFSCSNPSHPDQPDVFHQSNVSSSITISTTRAIGVDTKCTCRAVWDPQPSDYVRSTEEVVHLAYKSSVVSFTSLTEPNTRAKLKCIANGRPAPNVTIMSHDPDHVLVAGAGSQEVSFVTNNTKCDDQLTFICIADNGFPKPDQEKLTVPCGSSESFPLVLVAGGTAAGVVVLVVIVVVVVVVTCKRTGHRCKSPSPAREERLKAYTGLHNEGYCRDQPTTELDQYSTIKDVYDGKEEKSSNKYDVIGSSSQNVYDEIPTNGKGSKKKAAKASKWKKGGAPDTTYLHPVSEKQTSKGGDAAYLHPVSKGKSGKGVDNTYLEPVSKMKAGKAVDNTYLEPVRVNPLRKFHQN